MVYEFKGGWEFFSVVFEKWVFVDDEFGDLGREVEERDFIKV